MRYDDFGKTVAVVFCGVDDESGSSSWVHTLGSIFMPAEKIELSECQLFCSDLRNFLGYLRVNARRHQEVIVVFFSCQNKESRFSSEYFDFLNTLMRSIDIPIQAVSCLG